MQHPKKQLNKLAIPTLDGLLFFDINDIIHLEANSNYTFMKEGNETRITVIETSKIMSFNFSLIGKSLSVSDAVTVSINLPGCHASDFAAYSFDGCANGTNKEYTRDGALCSLYVGKKAYAHGVGSTNFADKVAGGLSGLGAERKLKAMYQKLIGNFEGGVQ